MFIVYAVNEEYRCLVGKYPTRYDAEMQIEDCKETDSMINGVWEYEITEVE